MNVESGGEVIAKHWQPALRFGFCRLVLQYIPVFGKAAVLDPDNIRSDPGNGPADSREASVYDDVVALRNDELMFVTQTVGRVADQIEQSLATRFDVSAVLNVVGRPILLSGRIIPLVKQCVEGFKHERLIFLLYCLTHNNSLILSLLRVEAFILGAVTIHSAVLER